MSAITGSEDGIVVAVAHVDFSPRQILDEAGQRLAEYAASAEAPGVLGITVLQQFARTNHFEVLGRFASAAVYLEQLSAPANRAYRGAIAPMLGSPHEDRLHRFLGAGQLPDAPIGSYVVLTQTEARPERHDRAGELLEGLLRDQDAAPGHLGQCHLERRGRAEHTEVLSVWSGEEAYDAYLAAGGAAQRLELGDELVAPVDDRRHHLLHGPWGSSAD